jgi:putative acetyltransferase
MTRSIRRFRPQDAPQIAQLFHDTVHEINIKHYSLEQVNAWAPDDLYFRNWAEVCSHRLTYVAEDNGTIAGFAELEPNGHINCFYCHKDYQGCGVGRQLYQAIATQALELGVTRLFVEASITAKPFFERMGFSVIQQQEVTCRGQVFINYQMEQYL